MADITATFETGTNGNTISTGDAGSATAWDAVSIGSNAAVIYDTTHVYNTLSGKISTGASAVTPYLEWVAALGTVTDHYGRIYIYFTANPAANHRLIRVLSGATTAADILILTTGKIDLRPSSGSSVKTSTNAISLNQWVRLEYHIIHSTTVGQMEVLLFNSPDSGTPTETITSTAVQNTLASGDRIRFGNQTATANTGPYWFDNIVAKATSYPGPAPTGTADPYPYVDAGYYPTQG